jgi:hypothetical protein
MSETFDTQNYIQYGQYQPYYINGFGISNHPTTPNTLLNIAAGSCLDSTGSFQLSSNTTLTINSAINGLNGLDTGTVAASTVYPVYLVWDPVTLQTTGAMISLSYTQPLMPFGYSAFLLIGYVVTDSSAHFLKGYWSAGNTSARTFTYDAYQATAITAGHAVAYANVNLITLVPNVANTPVQIFSSFTPNAATTSILSLQAGNATGAQATITGQVATVPVTTIDTILAQPVTITGVVSPVINYKGVSASDSTAISVAGYIWFV